MTRNGGDWKTRVEPVEHALRKDLGGRGDVSGLRKYRFVGAKATAALFRLNTTGVTCVDKRSSWLPYRPIQTSTRSGGWNDSRKLDRSTSSLEGTGGESSSP